MIVVCDVNTKICRGVATARGGYLAGERGIAFSEDGIFRLYPELGG